MSWKKPHNLLVTLIILRTAKPAVAKMAKSAKKRGTNTRGIKRVSKYRSLIGAVNHQLVNRLFDESKEER